MFTKNNKEFLKDFFIFLFLIFYCGMQCLKNFEQNVNSFLEIPIVYLFSCNFSGIKCLIYRKLFPCEVC